MYTLLNICNEEWQNFLKELKGVQEYYYKHFKRLNAYFFFFKNVRNYNKQDNHICTLQTVRHMCS